MGDFSSNSQDPEYLFKIISYQPRQETASSEPERDYHSWMEEVLICWRINSNAFFICKDWLDVQLDDPQVKVLILHE